MTSFVDKLSNYKIVPVIVVDKIEQAIKLANVLHESGMPCLEITFRTANADIILSALRKTFSDMCIGVGTVLTPVQVDRAMMREQNVLSALDSIQRSYATA